MIHIGVDPGKTGAVAVINTERMITAPDKGIALHDIPLFDFERSGTGKHRRDYNRSAMAALLRPLAFERPTVYLERVGSRPDQGHWSPFELGDGFGTWRGICAALGIPVRLINPASWKREFQLLREPKDTARLLVIELFPHLREDLKLKKHGGRADALLIAEYGRRRWGRGDAA